FALHGERALLHHELLERIGAAARQHRRKTPHAQHVELLLALHDLLGIRRGADFRSVLRLEQCLFHGECRLPEQNHRSRLGQWRFLFATLWSAGSATAAATSALAARTAGTAGFGNAWLRIKTAAARRVTDPAAAA